MKRPEIIRGGIGLNRTMQFAHFFGDGGDLPVNTVLPVIADTFEIGQELTATTGTWTGTEPISYSYQWKRDGVNISGAINSAYTPTGDDDGTELSVTVTATNSAGSASATSNNSSQEEVLHEIVQEAVTYAQAEGITVPSSRTLSRLSGLITRYDNAGIITIADVLFIFSNNTSEEFSLLDILNPDSREATKNSWSGSHSSKGFKGAGTSFLNLNWIPSTGVNFTQNNGAIVSFVADDVGQNNGILYGSRNASTQVNLTPRGLAVANATRHMINDNTNDDMANNETSLGVYISQRTGATAKSMYRTIEPVSNATRTSVGRPDVNMYGLARNNQGTADAFSTNTIGLLMGCASLSAAQRLEARNAWLDYYLAEQEPIFVTSERELLIGLEGNETSIFGFAKTGNTCFFGVTEDDADPSDPVGYSVQMFTLTGPRTGTRGSIVIDVADYEDYVSIFPFDIYVDGATTYMACVVRKPSNATHDIVLFSADSSDLTTWTFIDEILTGGSTGHFNHAPYFFEHPDNPTFLYIAYSFKNVSADPLQLNIVRAAKSDLTSWSSVHTNIVPATPTIGRVYPKVFWDAEDEIWKMIYSRFYPAMGENAFSTYATESADLSSFPVGDECLWPTGVAGAFDAQYTANLLPDLSNGVGYFSGRSGGSETGYNSIMVCDLEKNEFS